MTFFLSCEKDFENETPKSTNLNYQLRVVYGENFFREKPNIKQELPLKSNQLANERMISNDYSIEIDETKVQIIQTTNYSVYTFIIERNNTISNDFLENYILVEYANDSIKHFIVNYPYNIVNNEKVFANNATITEISNPNLVYSARNSPVYEQIANPNCEWVPYFSTQNVFIPGERCGCHGNHVYGDNECDCPPSPPTPGTYESVDVTTWKYECYTGGGGSSDSNDGDNPSGNPSDTDSDSNSQNTPNDQIITAPFDSGLEIINLNCDELKEKSQDISFKQKMQELSQDANGVSEAGVALYDNSPKYASKQYGG